MIIVKIRTQFKVEFFSTTSLLKKILFKYKMNIGSDKNG